MVAYSFCVQRLLTPDDGRVAIKLINTLPPPGSDERLPARDAVACLLWPELPLHELNNYTVLKKTAFYFFKLRIWQPETCRFGNLNFLGSFACFAKSQPCCVQWKMYGDSNARVLCIRLYVHIERMHHCILWLCYGAGLHHYGMTARRGHACLPMHVSVEHVCQCMPPF